MMKDSLTQDRLKSLLSYDKDKGIFTWARRKANKKPGDAAGCAMANGYWCIRVDKNLYLAHRLAWLYVYGAFPDEQIDHINRDRMDNRISNLRSVSDVDNKRNLPPNKRNTSGHQGISWHSGVNKWYAYIGADNKTIALGTYADINDAIHARKQAEIRHGFHKNHGKLNV